MLGHIKNALKLHSERSFSMNPTKNFDVIIIGAGPSGIFCAYELIQKKWNILIDYYKKEFGIDLRKMGNTTFE